MSILQDEIKSFTFNHTSDVTFEDIIASSNIIVDAFENWNDLEYVALGLQ